MCIGSYFARHEHSVEAVGADPKDHIQLVLDLSYPAGETGFSLSIDPHSTVLKHTQAHIQAGRLINFNCMQKFLYCLLEMIQHMKRSTGGWSLSARYQVFPFLPGLSAVMSCPDVSAVKLITFHQYKGTSCSPSIPTSICCLKQAKKTTSDVNSSFCSSDHQLSENNKVWKAYGPSHKNNKHTNKPSDEFPESAGSVC